MMQIIFDEKLVPELQERYIILELDTVMQPGMTKPIILYALIEDPDIETITRLPDLLKQHHELVTAYKDSQWDVAKFNAYAMKGAWKGQLDEFYDLVAETSADYESRGEQWNGVRHTTPVD
jgi:hypothetical protein